MSLIGKNVANGQSFGLPISSIKSNDETRKDWHDVVILTNMPLFVSNNGHLSDVETDLLTISLNDGGLGDSGLGNVDPVQIIYNPSNGGFGPNLLDALINQLANSIFVSGVDSTFILPDGTPITNAAGTTFCPDGAGNINVVYDVGQCGGQIYYLYDAGGNQISFDNFLILCHELSHAYHYAIGDATCTNGVPDNPPAYEVQGENDENQCRQEHGMALRDPNNHNGGCGFTGPPPPPPCFMVTAALGSPYAPQLLWLRLLRDQLLHSSIFGEVFYEHLYAEYDQFSPQIADEMRAFPKFKRMISKLTVEPLLAFFEIVEMYVKEGWNQSDFAERVAYTIRQFRESLTNTEASLKDVPSIQCFFAVLPDRLSTVRDFSHQERPKLTREPQSVMHSLEHLASVVQTALETFKYTKWTLIAPLAMFWSAVESLNEYDVHDIQVAKALLREIDLWLGDVPIPSKNPYNDKDSIASDLARLSQSAFTKPSIRRCFGARLLKSHQIACGIGLKDLLIRSGYLDMDQGKH